MSIVWLVPAALAGLALVVVPIAIHWLVTERRPPAPFPSLRFLGSSRVSSLRRRGLDDAMLLACRVLIVGAGVAALAGPVAGGAWRDRQHAQRLARAVVLSQEAAADRAADAEWAGAFRGRTFARADLRDALADGLRWLRAQPMAAREVVIVSRLSRGEVIAVDLRDVPPDTGIRFVRADVPPAPRRLIMPVLQQLGDSLSVTPLHVELSASATSLAAGPPARVAESPVAIVAADADRALAAAALRAVLAAGIAWTDADRRLLIAWDGADPRAVSQVAPGTTIVRMPVPVPAGMAAARLAEAIAGAVATPGLSREPEPIGSDELQRWSRPPGPPPRGATPVDEGDRRWLWLAALVLLAVEHWLRRTPRSSGQAAVAGPEVHVA